MNAKLKDAFEAARTLDVSTPKDKLVLYSVSFLPTKENRDKAFAHVKRSKGKMVIEHTDCGAKLIELGFASSETGLSDEDIADVWAMASKRMIEQAEGDITVFVDNADPRSVFRRIELPAILANPNIKTINKIDKNKFR